jgi:hypothetical protein
MANNLPFISSDAGQKKFKPKKKENNKKLKEKDKEENRG